MARRLDRLATAVMYGNSGRERLHALHYLRARLFLDELEIVNQARSEGMTWKEIADLLGMTESGARRKYVARKVA